MFKLGKMYDYTFDQISGDKLNKNKEVIEMISGENKNRLLDILVIEDMDYKMDNTVRYLEKANEKLNQDGSIVFTRVETLIDAKRAIDVNTYHGIVIDMQFPVRNDDHIDRKAGIDFLNILKWREIDTPNCINSSGIDSQDLMNDYSFTKTMFILNSSFNCATKPFENFLQLVIEYYDGKKETEEI